jgi:hypothetical protein
MVKCGFCRKTGSRQEEPINSFFSLLPDLPTFPILSIKTVLQSSRSSGDALRDLEAVTFEYIFFSVCFVVPAICTGLGGEEQRRRHKYGNLESRAMKMASTILTPALRDLEAVTFDFFFLFSLFCCSRYLHWPRRRNNVRIASPHGSS